MKLNRCIAAFNQLNSSKANTANGEMRKVKPTFYEHEHDHKVIPYSD